MNILGRLHQKTQLPHWFGLLALAFFLPGCGQSDDPVVAEEYFQTVEPLTLLASDRYAVERQFSGLVVPRQTTDISFELSGELAALAVDEGDRIEPGQVLAKLDTQLLQAERNQLRAQRSDLDAQLVLNASNRERQKNLKSRGFAADQRLDELAAERDSLAANTARIDAALAANQIRLNKSQLVAPFGGTVSRRFIDGGAVVANGQPVFRLLESAAMEIRAGVPARLVGAVNIGDSVEVAAANQRWSGVVLAVGSDVTRATLTVPVRISIGQDADVVAGDQAYLLLDEPVETAGFWVPLAALTDGMRGLWNVYVLAPLSGGLHRLEARDVTIEYLADDRAFVSGALAADELIAASGLQRLVPGQQVRLSDPAALADNRG